jgi:anti-sigma B factor antagonist
MAEQLTITVTDHGVQRRVCLAGEIDIAVEDQFTTALLAAVHGLGVDEVVVDMAGLRFIDASGLRALARAAKAADSDNRSVRVRNCHGQVEEVLHITGMDGILQLRPAAGFGAFTGQRRSAPEPDGL